MYECSLAATSLLALSGPALLGPRHRLGLGFILLAATTFGFSSGAGRNVLYIVQFLMGA